MILLICNWRRSLSARLLLLVLLKRLFWPDLTRLVTSRRKNLSSFFFFLFPSYIYKNWYYISRHKNTLFLLLLYQMVCLKKKTSTTTSTIGEEPARRRREGDERGRLHAFIVINYTLYLFIYISVVKLIFKKFHIIYIQNLKKKFCVLVIILYRNKKKGITYLLVASAEASATAKYTLNSLDLVCCLLFGFLFLSVCSCRFFFWESY